MKRFKVFLGLFVMMITGMLLSLVAFASALSVKVPVTVAVEGAAPSTPEKYVINMKASDASYPMPAGASEGLFQTTVEGAGSTELAVDYERVGVYTYTIYQSAGSMANGVYDETVYNMVVTISNPEAGEGLESTVALHVNSMDTKPDAAAFTNKYKSSDLTLVKALINTGSGDNGVFLENDVVRYTVTVTNTGEMDLTDITVKEDLAGAIFGDAEGITLNEAKDTATIASLNQGENIVLQVTYVITAADAKNGSVKNTVTGTYTTPGGDTPTVPSNSVDITTGEEEETESETETEEPDDEEDSEEESETEKEKETEKKAPENTNAPKTGDDSPIGMYAGLMAAAFILMAAIVLLRKRRKA